jgi:hypothetical protein
MWKDLEKEDWYNCLQLNIVTYLKKIIN